MRGRSDVCGVEVGESADWRDRAVAYERSFGRLCAGSAAPTLAAICDAGPPGGRLLDVGTGTGTIAGLARQRGFRTHGVDAEPSMVAAARDLRPGPDYVVGRLPALPYEDAAFDAVTAGYVVNHVPDPRAAVVELARVAGPGSPVALTVWPNEVSPLNACWNDLLDRAGATRPAPRRLSDELDFPRTPEGVGGLLADAGLAPVRTTELGWDFRIAPPDLWPAVGGGLATVGQAYLAQDPAGRERIRATFATMGEERAVDGVLTFRATAVLGVGRVAGR